MIKLLTTLCIFATLATIAQTSDSTKKRITGYVSTGLSLTSGNNFKMSSYTSVEAGGMRNNISLGLAFGRGNLYGMGSSTDNIQNYFYEVKAAAYYPFGSLTGVFLFGYGGFLQTQHNFIEYGAGVSYSVGKMGYGATCSNWNGVTYVTPSVTLNF